VNPAITFDDMRKSLGYRIKNSDSKVMLVGLLFCPPTTKLAKEEILPALLDFHYSSADKTQFYFPGYFQVESPSENSIGPKSVEAPEFEYNARKFNEFVRIIEKKYNWKYSGGTDLLIVNARRNSNDGNGYLDFSSSIPLTLETVKQKGNYPEIRMFFEKIFNFSEEYTGKNPVYSLSDEIGKTTLSGAFKEFVFRLLPTGTKGKVEEGLLFASSDLRRSKGT
jgi:hypothetical protein